MNFAYITYFEAICWGLLMTLSSDKYWSICWKKYLLLIVLLNKPKRTNMENYLREFKAVRISLNKVREIKSRKLKAERKLVRREV